MKIKEITPQNFMCWGGGCPAVFEITPEAFRCVGGGCSSVFKKGKGELIIIGRKVKNLKKLGLSERVGKDEEAVIVDKEMIRQLFEK